MIKEQAIFACFFLAGISHEQPFSPQFLIFHFYQSLRIAFVRKLKGI